MTIVEVLATPTRKMMMMTVTATVFLVTLVRSYSCSLNIIICLIIDNGIKLLVTSLIWQATCITSGRILIHFSTCGCQH